MKVMVFPCGQHVNQRYTAGYSEGLAANCKSLDRWSSGDILSGELGRQIPLG